ncbi:MAG: hypothetical protein ACYTKD_01655 [Planctomycetota bacterium]|jgi:hypothetical protein
MRARAATNVVAASLIALCAARVAEGAIEFRTVDVFITSDAPLAAWQVDVRYDRSTVKILSLEGGEEGEDAAWREPPHHDARGMSRSRIMLAAFVNDDAKATTGRARVARLHVEITVADGDPGTRNAAAADIIGSMRVRLVAAAQAGGERIAPTVELAMAEVITPGTDADTDGDADVSEEDKL